jgi:hypothetical protein
MNNPPIIKPKISSLATKFAKSPAGRVVGLSPMGRAAMGILGLGAVGPSVVNAMNNAEERSANLPKDVILAGGGTDAIIPDSQPLEIQDKLNNLTKSIAALSGQEKKKKPKEVKKDELAEFDDAKDFKKWIKKNTETDDDGNVSFIQPITKEKISIENNPESNVLLYEVFKEQTGRTGEAAEVIKNMDIAELQADPTPPINSKASLLQDIQLLRGQDLPAKEATGFQKLAKLGGQAVGAVGGIGMTLATKNPRYLLPLAGGGGYAGGKISEGTFGYGEDAVESSQTPRAEQYAEAQAKMLPIDYNDPGKTMSNYQNAKILAKMEYEDQQAANSQRMAFRKPGEEWQMTPTAITPLEARQLESLGYEFGPANLNDEEFMREAMLAGRIPAGPTALEIEKAQLDNALTLSKIEKNYADMQAEGGASPLMHKKAYGIKLPGMYSRNSNEGLEYKVRLLEDDQGNTRLTADLDLAPVMAEIYRAERYTEETQGEIEEVRNLLGPDTIGLSQRVNDVLRGINALSGTSRGLDVEIDFQYDDAGNVVTDDFGQPVLDERSQKVAAEVLSRWAKRFTAQNITTLLGESNRTISDADRKRADDIVNILGTTTDLTSAWIALDELLTIFEKPSQNANTALQALYAQAEQSGYMDEVLEIEDRLRNEVKRGGSRLSVPQSSRFKFQSVSASDIPKDAVVRTIDLAGGS